MRKITFYESCPLTEYLEHVSMLDGGSRKVQFAGALLYGLGFPRFTQKLPDITFTAKVVQHIGEDGQTDLLSETKEKCLHCPQLSGCEVGPLFKVG